MTYQLFGDGHGVLQETGRHPHLQARQALEQEHQGIRTTVQGTDTGPARNKQREGSGNLQGRERRSAVQNFTPFTRLIANILR